MRQYATIPIDRLVSDVAVDAVHVRELADSIKVSGPISPVLVREDKLTLIDGFHRVAAMKELGFNEVECILTPCDDETFWDLRIISASTHKTVTFARVVDWIEEVFSLSPWKGQYKDAFNLFEAVGEKRDDRRNLNLPVAMTEWVATKSQKWGLAPTTIRNWLQTKRSLAPDLLKEVTSPPSSQEGGLGVGHYRTVAETLSRRPDLQRQVIDKAKRDDLSMSEVKELAKAAREAADEQEVDSILAQPISRTAEDLTRNARVDKLLAGSGREPSPREQHRKLTGVALEVSLDLQQGVHSVARLTREAIEALTPDQKDELHHVVTELLAQLHQLDSILGQRLSGAKMLQGR